jgi:hypothetical protein
MVIVIQSTKVKSARKEYSCEACYFLQDGLDSIDPGKLTFAERRAIVRARQDNWKIKKGQPYTYQFNKYDGDPFVFRGREDIHAICVKYDFYPED